MAKNSIKRYDAYKGCVIRTPDSAFEEVFTSDWTFSDIKSWMLDTFCIDESAITEIEIYAKTIYKRSNEL